ncbi:NF-kappa-B inhibitor beta-like [Heterodontus francisci]|uniref:NF-kappa-B inhibitor beta-like n=1 Tax=Heterodontus francisci TaxID=7792 RepID=UPI00355B0FE8
MEFIQQRQLNGIGSKQPSKLGAGKVAAPWGGKANLESLGVPLEAEGDDYFDSGIGSLSELQVGQFNELGSVDQGIECGEGKVGVGQVALGAEPDICPSTQQRVESGIGQITRGIEKVELGDGQETVANLTELLNFRTEDFDSMLHLAIIHEEDDFFDHVLHFTKGTNYLNLQNDMKQTALHLAVIIGRADLVEKLVAAGANLLLQEKDGNTALHLACKEMVTSCVQALLFHQYNEIKDFSLFDPSQVRQQLHCYNYQGFQPLHVAVILNDVYIVEYLLLFEVDINAKETCAGRTALHLAVELQNRQIVKLLLDRRADVHAQMYNGCTPICLAVYRPDSGITQMLRDYGSSEPVTDEDSDEGIDEDGMGEYDDFVVHGC